MRGVQLIAFHLGLGMVKLFSGRLGCNEDLLPTSKADILHCSRGFFSARRSFPLQFQFLFPTVVEHQPESAIA